MIHNQKKSGRRRIKCTIATIRSAIAHQENAKNRNDPIVKTHYNMHTSAFRDHQRFCVQKKKGAPGAPDLNLSQRSPSTADGEPLDPEVSTSSPERSSLPVGWSPLERPRLSSNHPSPMRAACPHFRAIGSPATSASSTVSCRTRAFPSFECLAQPSNKSHPADHP